MEIESDVVPSRVDDAEDLTGTRESETVERERELETVERVRDSRERESETVDNDEDLTGTGEGYERGKREGKRGG